MNKTYITLENVEKKINKKEYLRAVSFSLRQGEVVTCAGERGAGGRILVSLLAGLLRPQKGTVKYEKELTGNLYGQVAYVPSTPPFFGTKSVADLAVETQKLHKAACRDEFYRLCEVFALVPEQRLAQMTLRENRKASFLINMMWKPRVLLVDDVENYLNKEDLLVLEEEVGKLAEQGTACFIESGKAETMRDICHRVLFLEQGKLIHDINIVELEEEYVLSVVASDVSKLRDLRLEEISRRNERVMCVCRASNEQIIRVLAEEKIENALVERLTLDEQILKDYARWM